MFVWNKLSWMNEWINGVLSERMNVSDRNSSKCLRIFACGLRITASRLLISISQAFEATSFVGFLPSSSTCCSSCNCKPNKQWMNSSDQLGMAAVAMKNEYSQFLNEWWDHSYFHPILSYNNVIVLIAAHDYSYLVSSDTWQLELDPSLSVWNCTNKIGNKLSLGSQVSLLVQTSLNILQFHWLVFHPVSQALKYPYLEKAFASMHQAQIVSGILVSFSRWTTYYGIMILICWKIC